MATTEDTIKLSRIYRSAINDIEDVLAVTIDGSAEQQLIQILMDTVEAAMKVEASNAM